jgi:hypothetical protein
MSVIIDTDGRIDGKLDQIILQQKVQATLDNQKQIISQQSAIVELLANVITMLTSLMPRSQGIDIEHVATKHQPVPIQPGP